MSFNFSENGQLLACGFRKGKEIIRIWDLTDSSFISYCYFEGSNSNLYTIINLTDSIDGHNDNKRLILASIGQKPVVFDVITRKFLYVCQCPINFEKIQKIISNVKYNCFIVRGKDKKNMALLYRLSDGKLLQLYDNFNNIDLSKYENIKISKSSNLNGGNLTINNIQNVNKITHNNYQLSLPLHAFYKIGNRSIVSVFDEEKNLKIIISEVKSGKMIAEINYTQNYDRHAEVDLEVNKEENIFVLRYIEFIEPLEM